MKNIFLLLFLLCLSLLSAQMKEWQSVSCEFPEMLENYYIWAMETGDSRYIYGYLPDSIKVLLQFEANGNTATCTKNTDKILKDVYVMENPYLENETTVYDQCDHDTFYKIDLQSGNITTYTPNGIDIHFTNCQFFLMMNDHYCLHYENKKLYRFTLNDAKGSMTYKELTLNHSPINVGLFSANVVVLNNKFYYLSEAGFCEVTVSGDSTASKLILKIDADAIDNTIKNSTLVTDKENRVWIINDTHGVQEYNSQTGKIKKIAKAPQIENRLECPQVCFHVTNYLYYIKSNGKILCLDITPQDDPDNPDNPDDPDNPDNPTKSYDQSGHTCGLLGFEFFAVLLGISIIRIYRHK